MEQRLIELEHFAQVFANDKHGYRAECSCGWASDWFTDDNGNAEAAAVDHYEVAGPADGVDAVLSGLLDLQDDLAEVVIWFADNWSTSLPVPDWYGRHADADGHVLVVVARCPDLGELDRVADVLDVSVTREPAFDQDGRPYWCAHRQFGRVRVGAWGLGQ